jgi:glycosyltransferase involved in cell wall biosynthesis
MTNNGFAYTFTVFTPTYNRAHTLSRVYESLAAQTFTDFEWVVVDDGSLDNTAQLVAGWQAQASFPIVYARQENQGKHVAFNRGVVLAKGRFFLPLDSDDTCLPQALARFKEVWESIPPDQRPRFAAVTALCQDEQGRTVGPPLPSPVLDSDAIEIKRRWRHAQEKWGFHLTEVLRRFPYPVREGALYMPEDLVWTAVAKEYKTRFISEPLRVYYRGADQLTVSRLRRSQAPGLALWHQAVLNREIGYLAGDPLGFLRSAVNYARFSFLAGQDVGEQWAGLDSAKARLIWLLGLGPGALLAIKDLARGLEE